MSYAVMTAAGPFANLASAAIVAMFPTTPASVLFIVVSMAIALGDQRRCRYQAAVRHSPALAAAWLNDLPPKAKPSLRTRVEAAILAAKAESP